MRSPMSVLGSALIALGCAQGGPAEIETGRDYVHAPDASPAADDPSEVAGDASVGDSPSTEEPPPGGETGPGPCPGACTPGTTEQSTETCGACGEGTRLRRRTCADDCTWGGWESSGGCDTAAACAPGETDVETRSCSSSCGGMQTRTRPCDATSCRWGSWSSWSACDATCCGDGTCGAGESCSSCADCQAGHLGTGENDDPCPASASEQWRCVTIPSWGRRGSQVCRGGRWITFHLDPRACNSCVCAFSSACCASSGC